MGFWGSGHTCRHSFYISIISRLMKRLKCHPAFQKGEKYKPTNRFLEHDQVDGLWLTVVQLKTFQLFDGAKVIPIQYTPYFEFWSFPRLAVCSPCLPHGGGQQRWTAAPSQPCCHEGKQLIHLKPFWTHTAILFFILHAAFNKLWDIQHLQSVDVLLHDLPNCRPVLCKCSEHS